MARAPAKPPAAAPRNRPIPPPATRPLQVYTTDPTRGYEPARRTTIHVDYEPLKPGPIGARIEVVDYDGYANAYYPHVDLETPAVLLRGGLDPSEGDPRFHQQMVYAVASRTLANFDRALGRRVSMKRGSRRNRLRILPHAFYGRNAFYDRELHALLFGYFEAGPDNIGANMPGQKIYTCLSHDIIAHEMTHAILDRLKRYFLERTNPDAAAFHEGFADIVALFQHFSFPDLVAAEIRRTKANLRAGGGLLLSLAEQFGFARGDGGPLRTAKDDDEHLLTLAEAVEEHERGNVLVNAVFDGFLTTFTAKTRDLILLATDGRGELPPGDLSPYLVERLATEAARLAQSYLSMCIRALDYLPPVDVTFGDYLRALVTADFILNPDDNTGQRAALIEGFRRRGIHPTGVISLAEESLLWPVAEGGAGMKFPPGLKDILSDYLAQEAAAASRASLQAYAWVEPPEARSAEIEEPADLVDAPSSDPLSENVRKALVDFAKKNRQALFLHPGHPEQPAKPGQVAQPARDIPIYLYSVNAAFRTASNGQPVIELIVQYVQTDPQGAQDALLGPIKVRGGTTMIMTADWQVRYAIARPLPGDHLEGSLGREARERPRQLTAYISALDSRDDAFSYMAAGRLTKRMEARMGVRGLHKGKR